MSRRSLVLALSLAGVAGTAALAFAPRGATRSPPPSATPTLAAPTPTRGGARPAAPPVHGTRALRFRLDSETRVTLGPAAARRVALSAALTWSDVERRDDGARVVQLALTGVRTTDPTTGLDRAAAPGTGLETPVYLTLDERGRIAALHVNPAMPMAARNTLRAVANALQRVEPVHAADEWTADELLYGDAVTARYRQLDARTIEKTVDAAVEKTVDETVDETAAHDAGGATRTATTRFELDRDDSLLALRRREHTREPVLAMTADSELALTRIGTRPSAGARRAWARDRDRLQALAVAPELDPAAVRRHGYAELDDGTPIGDLVAMLLHTSAEADDGRARNYLQRRLVARLALQPDEAGALARAVRGELAAADAQVAIGALAAVDHDATERALIELATDAALEPALAADAADALTAHATPSEAAVGALRALADADDEDLRGTAALGLGSLAHALAGTGRAATVVDELLARFAAARSDAERLLHLGALGNTGSPRVLPVIERVLADGSQRLREQAAASLRLIADPRADRLLGSLLAAEPDPHVRRAALFAARFRPLAPLWPALEQVVRRDQVTELRREALELIAAARDTLPAAGALLAWVAESDPAPALRARARELLG